MSNNSSKKLRWLLLLTAVGIVVSSVLSITPPTSVTTINFSETITPVHTHNGPTLHVAIAAITSPETAGQLYHDLLLLLGKKLNYTIELIQRPTYSDLDKLLETGEVDVAFICSGTYAIAHDRFGLELLVIPVIEGNTTYHSDIIVAENSPFQSLDDLQNHRFALTSRSSNTGYLAPTYMLFKRGETIDHFFSETIMSHGHDNSVQAVANGLVEGAAVDSLVLEHMVIENNPYALSVRTVESSQNFAIPPVVVPKQLAPKLKQQLRTFFLEAHKTKEGRKILNALRIDYFTLGDDNEYNSIREMARLCEGR